MSGINEFMAKASTSHSQVPASMANIHKLPAAASPSSSSLSTMAKAVTRFLFGEAELPAYLSHFDLFFKGFVAGAIGAPALYAYLTRNHCDRGKVQLAVFHVMRLFQQRPEYAALMRNPQHLLALMEPEVMFMVDKHLTQREADQVVVELKRNYDAIAAEEQAQNRLREEEHVRKRARAAQDADRRAFEAELVRASQHQVRRRLANSLPQPLPYVTIGRHKISRAFFRPRPEGERHPCFNHSPPPFRSAAAAAAPPATAPARRPNPIAAAFPPIPHIPRHLRATPCPRSNRPEALHAVIQDAHNPAAASTRPPQLLPRDALGLDNSNKATHHSSPPSSPPPLPAEPLQPPVPQAPEHQDPLWLRELLADRQAKRASAAAAASTSPSPSPSPRTVTVTIEPEDAATEPLGCPAAPVVVRKLHGRKCAGTALSPIKGSPAAQAEQLHGGATQKQKPVVLTEAQASSGPRTTPLKCGRGRGRRAKRGVEYTGSYSE